MVSEFQKNSLTPKSRSVLILIVVEYGLGEVTYVTIGEAVKCVLILIVVEYGLGANVLGVKCNRINVS